MCLVNISRKIQFVNAVAIVYLAVSRHYVDDHPVFAHIDFLHERQYAIFIFKHCIHYLLLPYSALVFLAKQLAFEHIELPCLVQSLHSKHCQSLVVGKNDGTIRVVEAQANGHVGEHLVQLIALRCHVLALPLQTAP